MLEIAKVYAQALPEMRFIGKKYGDGDRVNGGFGAKWEEWNKNGWFDVIGPHIGEAGKLDVEDGEASIGLMRWKEGEPFEYWIGMFASKDWEVPAGFESVDFPPSTLGVCWLKGHVPDIFAKEHLCAQRLEEQGYKIALDDQQACWFFERYASRFMDKDQDGAVILDICHFIEP